MLFKPVVVLLTSVLHAAVAASISSLRTAEEDAAESAAENEAEREDGLLHLHPSPDTDMNAPRPGLRRRAAAEDWHHGAYSVSANRRSRKRSGGDGVDIEVKLPERTTAGDTLFLFLSRTDGLLPLTIDGWTRGAECFKSTNRQETCLTVEEHCMNKIRIGKYTFCSKFRQGRVTSKGTDLGTVVFHKRVTSNQEPGCFTLNLPGKTTTWAILTAIPSVSASKPIFSAAGTSCDVAWGSVFPSVKGKADAVLLLSQSFDDTAARADFLPPAGTTSLGFTSDKDEAGFLYGKKLDRAGDVGEHTTKGAGGPKCKDALLSVVVNRRG